MTEEEALKIVEAETKRFEHKMRGIVELDEVTRNDNEKLASLLEDENAKRPKKAKGESTRKDQFQSALDLLRKKGKYKKK